MRIISSNITSPLGTTTEENYRAVRSGRSACLPHKAGERDVPFDFCAALFPEPIDFERLAISSATDALGKAGKIDTERTILILSTTKGDTDSPLGDTASRIAVALGIPTPPIVVCNACISGAAAMVLALRLLRRGTYDYAVVIGADVQTRFTLAGFNSLMALSDEPCRPFDAERRGLNLGEAAATVVITSKPSDDEDWHLTAGAITNDAYHTSTPHPKGEGCMRAINQVMEGYDASRLATISVHGTATMYNDQMESKAIERAGLSATPLSALKGYYGHTLGAAGLLETILTARALDDGIILPCLGYNEIGVSGKVCISQHMIKTDKRDFLKIISGFGGCNAALLLRKQTNSNDVSLRSDDIHLNTVHRVRITNNSIVLDDTAIPTATTGRAMLTEVYRQRTGQYPRFHKMDTLCRLAFVATELLTEDLDGCTDDMCIVLFNKTSSMVSDRKFRETISDDEHFFPSPSVFVYTLPNICTGEIALRHKTLNETSFYILPCKDDATMHTILQATMLECKAKWIIGGWIDCKDDDDFECEVGRIEGLKK